MARAHVDYLVAALLLLPLGCGKKPQAEATPGDVTSKEVPTVSIRLLAQGTDSPARALRFRPAVGATSRVRFKAQDTWHQNEKTHSEGAVFTLEGHVIEITPDNDVRYSFKVIRVEDVDGGTLSADPSALTQLTEEVTINPQGAIRQRELKGYRMAGGMELFRRALSQIEIELAPIFPVEPVGVGARWEVEQPAWKGMYNGSSKAVYTLVKQEGSRVTLRIESTQRAEKQAMSLLNPGSQQRAVLLSMTGAGSATLSFSLEECPLAAGSTQVSLEEETSLTNYNKTELLHAIERLETEIVAGDR